jgi:hypothetical protein
VEFVELEEARERSGLRLVTVAGVPSPWSEAAKGILHVKKLPFVCVRMGPGENPVTRWTGQTSAPVAMYDDETPRAGWAEILLLAERLAPSPPLVPAGPAERALLFGLSHEICGEMGLGWCRRLTGIAAALESDGTVGFPRPIAEYLGAKYGYRTGCGPEARARVVDVLRMLSARLRAQREAGSSYYLNEELSAVDIYSAAFMGIFAPLGPDECPMPEGLRASFETRDLETTHALDPILLEHRDFVYRSHLVLPMEF